MQTSVGQHAVLLHPLEKDDRVDEVARFFPKALKLERAYPSGQISDAAISGWRTAAQFSENLFWERGSGKGGGTF